jgi:hypothetical protein
MISFNKQGEIDVTGTILYTSAGDIGPINTSVTQIRVSNNAAYTYELFRFDFVSGLTTKIYSFSLDAGDVFTDDYNYLLKDGDYLIAYTDIPGTNYLITVFDATR